MEILNNITFKVKNANEAFENVLRKLKTAPEAGPRGFKTREILNAKIIIEDPSDVETSIIMPVSKKYLIGELVAYWDATNKLEEFAKFSSFWEKISDDGETVRSAYGYVVKKKYGFDQIDYVVKQLEKDSESRKAVIHYKQAYNKDTKDNLCTISNQFFIRDNKLYMTVNMRSNDIVLGFRYDVYWFALLQRLIAERLGVGLGEYTHNAASLHIYERHFKAFDKLDKGIEKEKTISVEFINEHTTQEFLDVVYEKIKKYE